VIPAPSLTLPPEVQIDTDNEALVERVQTALTHSLSQTFQLCLDTLVRLASNVHGTVHLYLDFAPLSFGFMVLRQDGSSWISGGVLFHGPHDGGGNGGAPTYSVCISPQNGWTVHT